MLAASEVNFTQKLISQRDQLLRMSDAQLPFGQLPLLQMAFASEGSRSEQVRVD